MLKTECWRMNCPRCQTRLQAVVVEAPDARRADAQICPRCEGSWLPRLSLLALADMDSQVVAASALSATLQDNHPEVSRDAKLSCPACTRPLIRFVYCGDSGVTADCCREHGIWLDDGELGDILRYLQSNDPFA